MIDRRANLVDELRRLKARVKSLELPRSAWTAATLANGFVNQGGSYAPAAFYKDSYGHVRLRGRVAQGATLAPVVMFVLPEGFRPVFRHEFPSSAVFADSVTRSLITVLTDGSVRLEWGDAGSGFPVNLDPVQFRVV